MKRLIFSLFLMVFVAGCASVGTQKTTPMIDMQYKFGPQELFESYDFLNHIYSKPDGTRINVRENRVVSYKTISTTDKGDTTLIVRMPRLEIARVINGEMQGSAIAIHRKGVKEYKNDPGISRSELTERTDRAYRMTINPKGKIIALSVEGQKTDGPKSVIEMPGNPFINAFSLYGFPGPDFPLTRGIAWSDTTKVYFPQVALWIDFELQLQIAASGDDSFQVIVFGNTKTDPKASIKIHNARMYAKYIFDAKTGFMVRTQQEYEVEYSLDQPGRFKEEMKFSSNNTKTK